MRTKSADRYANLKEKALGTDGDIEKREPKARRSSVLGKRQATVEAVASGKIRTVKIISHDPDRIRPWAGHNRDYAALSAERCADLIDGFRRADQQFPAIVREVSDSADFDYEFICGARRHWTANYLGRDLIIEVRNIDDRDAFLLQDIENRDREDISDYERACDYLRALPVYFEGKKSHMAEQLQIDQGNFTRFLALAEMPREIVDAYADIRELLVHHGTLYTKFLKDPGAKRRVLTAAKELKGKGASGRQVIAKLKEAAAGQSKIAATPTAQRFKQGALSVTKHSTGGCMVSFPMPDADNLAAVEALRNDFNRALEALLEKPTTKTRKNTRERRTPVAS